MSQSKGKPTTGEFKGPSQSSQTAKGESASLHCCAQGCKKSEARFGFCDQHYEHFKFGLIKKNGQPVPDYHTKSEHYEAYLAKQKTGNSKAGLKKAA
jgi:hypothetical protein